MPVTEEVESEARCTKRNQNQDTMGPIDLHGFKKRADRSMEQVHLIKLVMLAKLNLHVYRQFNCLLLARHVEHLLP